MSFMSSREKDALDKYITGNYGEDQYSKEDFDDEEENE